MLKLKSPVIIISTVSVLPALSILSFKRLNSLKVCLVVCKICQRVDL